MAKLNWGKHSKSERISKFGHEHIDNKDKSWKKFKKSTKVRICSQPGCANLAPPIGFCAKCIKLHGVG